MVAKLERYGKLTFMNALKTGRNRLKEPLRVSMLSLGCPKTLVDSELVLGKLDVTRYQITDHVTECDIAFLNTCAFIEDAKQESIDRILELVQLKKEGTIRGLIVLGCLVQRYPNELAKEFEEVDAFVGTGDYARIPEVIQSVASRFTQNGKNSKRYFEPFTSIGRPGYMYKGNDRRVSLTPKHFRYVKISEGCDHTCSFCTIPSFRGKHRSRPVQDVVGEVERLAKDGCREVVLTGQDTSNYGLDLSKKFLMPELLQSLSQISSLSWIRILYAYPTLVNDGLISAIQNTPKVCHYLDMPLQHVSDPILRSMRRGINQVKTRELITKLRNQIPDLALRTTFIVGYPGETERHFGELLDFMTEARFERLGIFTYSVEEDTPAAVMRGQVDRHVKQKRFERAMALQQDISSSQNDAWVGKLLDVMIDAPSENDPQRYVARSYMDAPEVDGTVFVKTQNGTLLAPGDIVRVRVTGAEAYDLTADLIS